MTSTNFVPGTMFHTYPDKTRNDHDNFIYLVLSNASKYRSVVLFKNDKIYTWFRHSDRDEIICQAETNK